MKSKGVDEIVNSKVSWSSEFSQCQYPPPCTNTHSCPQRPPACLWGRIPSDVTASSLYNIRAPSERQRSNRFWGRQFGTVCEPTPGRARQLPWLDAGGSEVRQASYNAKFNCTVVVGKGRLGSACGKWVTASPVLPRNFKTPLRLYRFQKRCFWESGISGVWRCVHVLGPLDQWRRRHVQGHGAQRLGAELPHLVPVRCKLQQWVLLHHWHTTWDLRWSRCWLRPVTPCTLACVYQLIFWRNQKWAGWQLTYFCMCLWPYVTNVLLCSSADYLHSKTTAMPWPNCHYDIIISDIRWYVEWEW